MLLIFWQTLSRGLPDGFDELRCCSVCLFLGDLFALRMCRPNTPWLLRRSFSVGGNDLDIDTSVLLRFECYGYATNASEFCIPLAIDRKGARWTFFSEPSDRRTVPFTPLIMMTVPMGHMPYLRSMYCTFRFVHAVSTAVVRQQANLENRRM